MLNFGVILLVTDYLVYYLAYWTPVAQYTSLVESIVPSLRVDRVTDKLVHILFWQNGLFKFLSKPQANKQ